MKTTLLPGLLLDFWTDLSDLRAPGLLWQLITLLLCVTVGSMLAHALRRRLGRQDMHSGAMRIGLESFSRVLSPLIGLVLIELSKPVLAAWHHVNLLRLFIPLLASFAIIRLAYYVLLRIFARGRQPSGMLLASGRIFSVVVWIGVALYVTGLSPDLLQFLDDTVVPVGARKISLLIVAQACLSVAITLILALWLGASLEDRLLKIETMHLSLRVVMARTTRAALVLIAVLVSLSLMGIDLTVLSVFGGALGVGLGLGLQKIASSYISGFVILLERSLAVGDVVAVDKYLGVVTQINTRYTVLQGLDGIESVVPNDVLISNALQNYSLTDSRLRLTTTVTVGFQTDLASIFPLLEQATANIARVSKLPAPQCLLSKFSANGLDIDIGFWIADPQNGRQGVLSEVNLTILQILRQNLVELPTSQREVSLVNPDDPIKSPMLR